MLYIIYFNLFNGNWIFYRPATSVAIRILTILLLNFANELSLSFWDIIEWSCVVLYPNSLNIIFNLSQAL